MVNKQRGLEVSLNKTNINKVNINKTNINKVILNEFIPNKVNTSQAIPNKVKGSILKPITLFREYYWPKAARLMCDLKAWYQVAWPWLVIIDLLWIGMGRLLSYNRTSSCHKTTL